MNRKLLSLVVLLIVITTNAQTIGLVGSGANGWPGAPLPAPQPDIMLTSSDNITYTKSNVTISTGAVKFRQDQDWAINWGANSFPTGTGIQNGADIPTQAGIYNITFNRTTGAYNFANVVVFPAISITGTSVGGFGTDVNMFTTDGIVYTLSGYNFTAGEVKFRQDASWTVDWGSTDFPSGIGTQGGPNIPLPYATMNVTFNRTTGAYTFSYVSIGILGTSVNGWDTDVDMNTTDGVTYTLNNYLLTDGLMKFRQDNSWTFNWGGTFPSATAVQGGIDIAVTPAANYNISFNRNTLEYSFTNTGGLGTNNFNATTFKVYPNPTNSIWNFDCNNEVISKITITSILGKVISTSSASVFDASSLSSGIYFAQIETQNAKETIKVIKY